MGALARVSERVGHAKPAAGVLLRRSNELVVPFVLGIIFVHRQNETGFDELSAKVEPCHIK